MKFKTLHKISNLIGARQYRAAARLIDQTLTTEPGVNWRRDLNKLSVFLRDPARKPFSPVLAQGNGKLPFLAFSVLPGVTCPGAGDCLNWCYSFKAWRYPASFARQAQNTVLIQSKPARIFDAFNKYNTGEPVTFRLYVDGDFDSVETVNRWFNFLAANPWLIAYGYSKSFNQLLLAIDAPKNYILNISGGHNADTETVKAARALPYARGEFLAVDVGYKVGSRDHGNRAHQKALRAIHKKNTGRSAFTCPGDCGDCTPAGHACGSTAFKNTDIIIASH